MGDAQKDSTRVMLHCWQYSLWWWLKEFHTQSDNTGMDSLRAVSTSSCSSLFSSESLVLVLLMLIELLSDSIDGSCQRVSGVYVCSILMLIEVLILFLSIVVNVSGHHVNQAHHSVCEKYQLDSFRRFTVTATIHWVTVVLTSEVHWTWRGLSAMTLWMLLMLKILSASDYY